MFSYPRLQKFKGARQGLGEAKPLFAPLKYALCLTMKSISCHIMPLIINSLVGENTCI